MSKVRTAREEGRRDPSFELSDEWEFVAHTEAAQKIFLSLGVLTRILKPI